MGSALHLVKRFFGSVVPRGPRRDDAVWAEACLLDGEVALWRQMAKADRRHAAGVAREVQHLLGPDVPRPVLAAALLHDVGKLDAGLGVYGRVIATISGSAVKRDPVVIKAWTKTTGFTRRVGLYLQHPSLGGDMLELAGSDPLTVTWAREHHLPADDCTLDPVIANALRDADND